MIIKPRALDRDELFRAASTYNVWTVQPVSYVLPASRAPVRPDHSISCAAPSASLSDDHDRALIAAIARGNQMAFHELHARYYRGIARFVRARTHRSDLTDEISNDALWVIWQCAGRFRGESKVSTWIMGIARNLSSAALRATRRDCKNASRALEQQGYEPWSQTDLSEWVRKALARLPAEQRTVLEMFYGLGQSCEEISRALDCPLGTVKTRMFHGRRKLREILPCLASGSPTA